MDKETVCGTYRDRPEWGTAHCLCHYLYPQPSTLSERLIKETLCQIGTEAVCDRETLAGGVILLIDPADIYLDRREALLRTPSRFQQICFNELSRLQ